MEDPANADNIIDEYLEDDGKRSELLALIANEKETAEKAIEFENDGENDRAINEWKKIFSEDEDQDEREYSSPNGPTIISRGPSKPWCDV